MAYEPIISATTTQTNGTLLGIGAVWTFTVNVPGAMPTSCVIVTPQDNSFLATAPLAVVLTAGVVTVKVTVSVSLALNAVKTFNLRILE